MTVTGSIAAEAMGFTLPHEHVMSTFGEEATQHPRYDVDPLFEQVLPYLQHVRSLGCETLFECTAAYFGRAPAILRQLSEASGLKIVTNTGYYGAAEDRYVPAHAYQETADALADRWLREWREGIDGTGIRPGFMKIGVDAGPLSDVDRKLVQAAARTHRTSGLTMAVHTGGNPAAVREQLEILRQEGVAPAAWVWVHAHNVEQARDLLPAAEAGAWIEFDGLGADTVARHLELVQEMKRLGFLGQVLLSHDGNAYPGGGRTPRPFEVLFTHFIPALQDAGFTPEEVHQLTVENPRRAFTVQVRTVG